jgi:hypothetical protein
MGKKSKSKSKSKPKPSADESQVLPDVTDRDYEAAHVILSKQYNDIFNCDVTDKQNSNDSVNKEYTMDELYHQFQKVIAMYQNNSINKNNFEKIYELSPVDFALSNLCEEGIQATLKQAAQIGLSDTQITQLTINAFSLDITIDMLEKLKEGFKVVREDEATSSDGISKPPNPVNTVTEVTSVTDDTPNITNTTTLTPPTENTVTTKPDTNITEPLVSMLPTNNISELDTTTNANAVPPRKPNFSGMQFYQNLIAGKVEPEQFDEETASIVKNALEKVITNKVRDGSSTTSSMDSVKQLTNLAMTLEKLTNNMSSRK